MASKSDFLTISLDEIDSDDHRFKISTNGPAGTLVDAIAHVGLVTPPILLRQETSYIIVSGFKRITACRQLGIKRITARIYPSDIGLEHCIRIAVMDNALMRELNLMEQARSIGLLDQLYPDQTRLCKEAHSLGLSVNADMAEKLRTISNMNAIFHNALMEGHIALPVALQLRASVEATAADRIATLLGEIGLSLNRQRELVDGLIGISKREEISINEVLDDAALNNILNDRVMDRKEKSVQVRAYLKARRYPEISKTEHRYQALVKALKLGNGVQLIPPPHFEGTTYAIKIDFKTYEELLLRYRKLEAPLESSTLQSLWDTIGMNST